MRGDVLVTGGSDGSVRVWSLNEYQPIHRLAAHDNSVTSLQFDDTRIVSGGSDGRVKVWDLRKGTLVRELSQPAEAVWRVVFEEEKAVIMASRGGKTVMEVSHPTKNGIQVERDPNMRRFGTFHLQMTTRTIVDPAARSAPQNTANQHRQSRQQTLQTFRWQTQERHK